MISPKNRRNAGKAKIIHDEKVIPFSYYSQEPKV
jgi:hypothetical protein